MMTLQDRKKMFYLGNKLHLNQLAKNVIPRRYLAPREKPWSYNEMDA